MEQDWLTKAYEDIAASYKANNEDAERSNNRIFRVLERMKGKAFVRNLHHLLCDCEAGMIGCGFIAKHQIVRSVEGVDFVECRYGKYIKGYWCDQWAVGDSGDSWEGFIYVQLKPGRFLKTPFQC